MYIEVLNDDIDKAKEALNNSGIRIVDIFDNIYEKMCEENIRYYIMNLIPDGGFLRDTEMENKILESDDETIEDIIKRSIKAMYDNDYLSEVVGECTTDAIEHGLRELFVEVDNND